MKTANHIQMDERHIYSLSGRAYPRVPPRDRNHLRERRLPFVKRIRAKGSTYYYFVGPMRSFRHRLPDVEDPTFDNAYLSELAKMEGGEAPPPYRYPDRSRVYFIGRLDTAIKVGVAINVKSRFHAIQSCCPIQLSILATTGGSYKLEKEYHRRFAAHRLHGEWFAPHPEILAEIDRLNAGGAA
jgi:hypothetical protein